jgi:hypothetical protein
VGSNAESDFRRLRAAGVTLPNHPLRARLDAQGMAEQVRSGSFQSDIQRVAGRQGRMKLDKFRDVSHYGGGVSPLADPAIADMHKRRQAVRQGVDSTSAQLAWPKQRDPFEYWKDKTEWFNPDAPDDDLKKIRSWTRLLYATHSLVPSLIDIYTRFPLLGLEFQHKDSQLVDFYSSLFLDELNYMEHLYDMGREFWCQGEVFSLGSWHDGIGCWEAEDIINPNDVVVSRNPLLRSHNFMIKVPEEIQRLLREMEPRVEYDALLRLYPDVVRWARQNMDIPVSDVLMKQLKFRNDPWSAHGTPILLRAFRQLMLEESLYSAQDAVADRFYSPLILARLGLDNVDDAGPWIPDPAELDSLRNDLNLALASDFRLLVYHHGLDIKNAFGREQMPKLDQDFNRIDSKLLGVFGIGEELLRGGKNSTYASGALNRELITSLLETYQVGLRRFMRERMEVVAERQGHYEYRVVGDRRVPIMETVLVYDEDTGEEYIQEKPKLALPEVHFASMNLRDETVERGFLTQLKSAGFPVSLQSMAVNVPIEFEEEAERTKEEKLKLVVMEQEFKKELFERLAARDLPIPTEYKAEYDAWKAGTGEAEIPGAMADLSDPTPTPNLAPSEALDEETGNGDAPPVDGLAPTPGFQDATAVQPRQRPEISDEMRATMPKKTQKQAATESILNADVMREVHSNRGEATEPAVYGGLMRFGTPTEMRQRRKMRLPAGIKIATPDEAAEAASSSQLSDEELERLINEARDATAED